MESTITTRLLVISDTHGQALQHCPSERVDVVIHCGDMTEESKLREFKTTLNTLKNIDAPLKLIIAAKDDWTLDTPVFQQKLSAIGLQPNDDAVLREYGAFGETLTLLESEDAKAHGIIYIHEGTHSFKLDNGANLTVYASPYTPSREEWGFNYDPQSEHNWSITSNVDIAITHCPPKGVLDMTGCIALVICIATGAKTITWREETATEQPSHFTDINNERSAVIETLSTLRPGTFDSDGDVDQKRARRERYDGQGYCGAVDLGLGEGMQTLFVNAAIEGETDNDQHLPWVVDLDLPKAREEGTTNTCKKRRTGEDVDESIKRQCRSD